jgi:molybdenum cofactor guanylyltransferase
MHPLRDLTGAVLAGGKGRRMGGAVKGQLDVGGIAIVERIIKRLDQCCSRTVIVANDPEPYRTYGRDIYPDIVPGSGSLGGIYTALSVATTEFVFVCACDMPFVAADLVRHLVRRIDDCDAVIPRDARGVQPMHGVYRRRTLPKLEVQLRGGDLKVEHFIESIGALVLTVEEVATVEPRGLACFNVNSPDDLLEANRRAHMVDPEGREERTLW